MEPPLVLVCASRDSNTLGYIQEGRCFAVNILAEGQDDLSNRFASKKLEHVRFEGVEYDTGETGAPLVRGAIANLDCSLHATYEAGDHLIYVGLIESVRVLPGEPLIYWNGRYCGVKSESEG